MMLRVVRVSCTPRRAGLLHLRRTAAAAAAGGGSDARDEAEMRAEVEAQRERQRWQDRYEFTDEEIEEEFGREEQWKERYREFKNWLRYHMNIFEEHDNLTERRERVKLFHKNPISIKFCIGLFFLFTIYYSVFARDKLWTKLNEYQNMGSGADWPKHYIAMHEILEGRRTLDEILALWDQIRDRHQRDWLLPLLAAKALVDQAGAPPALRRPDCNPAIIDRLAEELLFVEADVTRMSAEIALHLHNLVSGDVKWPARKPNLHVLREIEQCIEMMAHFRIHPVLQRRMQELNEQNRSFYNGSGYFNQSSQDLQVQSVSR